MTIHKQMNQFLATVKSDGSVPVPIQELFDRLNQDDAWLEITQSEDDSFSDFTQGDHTSSPATSMTMAS